MKNAAVVVIVIQPCAALKLELVDAETSHQCCSLQ